MGLLRTILIIIVIYYIFRFIGRYVLPFVLRNYIRKKMGGNYPHANGNRNSVKNKPEGKVTITNQPKGKKIVTKDKGDYVDFEDIKE